MSEVIKTVCPYSVYETKDYIMLRTHIIVDIQFDFYKPA